jgi:hypothetical protein
MGIPLAIEVRDYLIQADEFEGPLTW